MPKNCPASPRPLNGYILPSVLVTIAHDGYAAREGARDGQITLGVPLGTDEHVMAKTTELVEGQNQRLRGLAHLD